MIVAEIEQKIRSSFSDSPNGCQCKFVPLDDKWAIKLYKSRQKRDETYDNQKMCFDVGYAPELGERIDLPNGPMRYGYITEIVETIFNTADYDLDADCSEDEDDEYSEVLDWEGENYSELNRIKRFLYQKTGWEFRDDHAFNWGMKDGKLIPIDFGVDDFNTNVSFDAIEAEMLALVENE
jgi:hypothetical protein